MSGARFATVSDWEGPVQRAPAVTKLVLVLVLILAVGALPARQALWGLSAIPLLLALAIVARLPLWVLLRRSGLVLPFSLGLGLLALIELHDLSAFIALFVKSVVSVLALQVLASTTQLSELLAVLRRARVPEVLLGTIALLHRYSFLMLDESRRMRRARAGRTLVRGRFRVWVELAQSLGLLFLRTLLRAERVQAAIRSRGGS